MLKRGRLLLIQHQLVKQKYKQHVFNKREFTFAYDVLGGSLLKLVAYGLFFGVLTALVNFSDMLFLYNFLPAKIHYQNSAEMTRAMIAVLSALFTFMTFLPDLQTGFKIYYTKHLAKSNVNAAKQTQKLAFYSLGPVTLVLLSLGLIILFFAPPLFLHLSNPLEQQYALQEIQIYLGIFLLGTIISRVNKGGISVFLVHGHLKLNFYLDIVVLGLNILFDALLILYTPLGIYSVALGTLLAYSVQSFYLLFLIIKHAAIFRFLRTKLSDKWKQDAWVMLKMGLPYSINSLGQALYNFIFFALLVTMAEKSGQSSVYWLSLFGAILPLTKFFNTIFFNLGQKSGPLYSTAVALNDKQRVYHLYYLATIYNLIFAVFIYCLLCFCPQVYTGMFHLFSVKHNVSDAVVLLHLQLCTLLTASLVVPSKPIFMNTGRVNTDIVLQFFRRFICFCLIPVFVFFVTNNIGIYCSSTVYAAAIAAVVLFTYAAIYLEKGVSGRKNKYLDYEDVIINR